MGRTAILDENDPIADCSGAIWAIFRECGITGITRVTAAQMLDEETKGGWEGRYIQFEELQSGDLEAYSLPAPTGGIARRRGHCSVSIDSTRYGTVALIFVMSSSKGGVITTLDKGKNNYLYKYLDVCKRLGKREK